MTEHICIRCGLKWDCGTDCGVKEIVGCGRTICLDFADYPNFLLNHLTVITIALEQKRTQKISIVEAGP